MLKVPPSLASWHGPALPALLLQSEPLAATFLEPRMQSELSATSPRPVLHGRQRTLAGGSCRKPHAVASLAAR